jgi:hypothetical protein
MPFRRDMTRSVSSVEPSLITMTSNVGASTCGPSSASSTRVSMGRRL